jgi:hypothetical protein
MPIEVMGAALLGDPQLHLDLGPAVAAPLGRVHETGREGGCQRGDDGQTTGGGHADLLTVAL